MSRKTIGKNCWTFFGLSAYKERLKIAKDYAIPDAICGMIEKLYPEDRELFSMYGDK